MSEHIVSLRAIVAGMPPAPPAMGDYLEKVQRGAFEVSDDDVDALKGAGVSEDEIFEQTVAAAISEGLRRLDIASEAIG